jgi:hypothetical protein
MWWSSTGSVVPSVKWQGGRPPCSIKHSNNSTSVLGSTFCYERHLLRSREVEVPMDEIAADIPVDWKSQHLKLSTKKHSIDLQ